MAESSHGTHVASIAAGNHGVCPNAMIAGVLIALTEDDSDRRKSFYDSTRIAHAVDYLVTLAAELKVPVAINISLGTNGHAHDASSAISRWIDAAMAVPGRCICVAAGNAGQEVAAFEGDIGYVMGRIHTSGRIPARGLNADVEWMVVGNGVADISENELEIWYSSQDRFAVSVKPPGKDWIGPVKPHEFIENMQLKDGSFLSIYNELYHPANGSNYISIYLSPFFNEAGVVGVSAGQWVVRLHGIEVRDGRYHGWIERDDPRKMGRVGMKEAWRFPSFFSERSNVDNSSVSSLACGQRIISVANLDSAREQINITSSQGPTRDGRFKPDVAAPGTDIVAANGFASPNDLWVKMTGTSMASPFVTGVAGLMLAIEPKLTAAQVEGILQCTARPLPGADFTWLNTAGFGRIEPEACLNEAATVNERKDLKP
jgi:subtilisin family serine protease